MDLDNVYVGDIETDGLLDTTTKLHVFSFGKKVDGEWKIGSTNNHAAVKKAFSNPENVFIMHNGLRFDKQAIEKIYGIEVKATIIDSLSLAWWLFPKRVKAFGLADFGEDYGIPKPKIEDWVGLSYEEYKHRCEEDVKINIKLWEELLEKGRAFYSDAQFIRLIKMLNFIMMCSAAQEEQKVKVDVDKTRENLAIFELQKEDKIAILEAAMPKETKMITKIRPAKMTKANGTLSEAGKKWVELLEEMGLPDDTEEVEVEGISKPPNPNSPAQKKAWLYSLGWVPETFEYKRDKETNTTKAIEQIVNKDTKMLCPSVLKLVKKEPAIEALDGLTVLTHRIGILEGFLKNMDENHFISQGLARLAVTMRWQHRTIVNIPKVTGVGDNRDGKWLRECLVAQEGTKFVQADLSGVESKTSDHYTFNLNPERIIKTGKDFFDAHTELSVVANLMTAEEEAFYVFNSAVKDTIAGGGDPSTLDYKNFSFYPYNEEIQRLHDLPESDKKKLMQQIKNKRSKGKTTNYASLYLVGAKTLSRNLDIPVKEAQALIDAYWEVHWAVKAVTETFRIKRYRDETWIYNPVSKFYYFLRNDKDRFSVINQSTAVYCFNMWAFFVSKRVGFPIIQTHDDLMIRVKDDPKVVDKAMLEIKKAMDDTNEFLKLNVELGCEVQSGYNFAETH